MKMLKASSVLRVLLVFAALATAQGQSLSGAGHDQEAAAAPSVLSILSANRSLTLFTTALRSSGMVRALDDGGPWTVFALSDRAFENIPREDFRLLMANPGAMHLLIGHYIARGALGHDEAASQPDVRTLLGTRLRIDVRGATIYVNGAEWSDPGIRCANGVVYVLDRADPQLVHDALTLGKATMRTEPNASF